MKICKTCGAQNDDMSVYCGSCGTLLDSSSCTIIDNESEKITPPSNEEATHSYAQSGNQPEYRPEVHNYQSTGNQYSSYNQQSTMPGYQPYATGMPQESLSKGGYIAVTIVSAVFGGIIGLVLALVALINANDYENAKRNGDSMRAKQKLEKAKKYKTAAWIVNIVAFIIIAIIWSFIFFAGFSTVDDYDFDDYGSYEVYGDEDDFPFDLDDFNIDFDLNET